jgi:hypothetical protein
MKRRKEGWEMIFERINTAVRKTIGYFGCLYAVYLAENHPYSWENLIKREDLIDILMRFD